MGERLPCTEEARGSSPLISTEGEGHRAGGGRFFEKRRQGLWWLACASWGQGAEARRQGAFGGGTLKTEQNAKKDTC